MEINLVLTDEQRARIHILLDRIERANPFMAAKLSAELNEYIDSIQQEQNLVSI